MNEFSIDYSIIQDFTVCLSLKSGRLASESSLFNEFIMIAAIAGCSQLIFSLNAVDDT